SGGDAHTGTRRTGISRRSRGGAIALPACRQLRATAPSSGRSDHEPVSGDHDLSANRGMTAVEKDVAAPVRCILCDGERFEPQFGPNKTAAPKATTPVEAYRITHSHRDLVHGVMRCVDCGLATLPAALRSVGANTYVEGEDPSYTEEGEQRI